MKAKKQTKQSNNTPGLSAASTATLNTLLTDEAERNPKVEAFILKLSTKVPLPTVRNHIQRFRKYAQRRK